MAAFQHQHEDLADALYHMYENDLDTDVTLVAEGQKVKAHKTVLIARSTYFRKLFAADKTKDEFVLKDVPFADLQITIRY